MREVYITDQCLEFFEIQPNRVNRKFLELIEVISSLRVVHSLFIKKLTNTEFYELRIRAGNEYRTIVFTLDHKDFSQSTEVVCLYAFQKKSTKDYNKAIKNARRILNELNHEKD